jgi:hypothetical protein
MGAAALPEQAQSASGRKAAQARADCLGLLGALDPARVALDLAPPPSLARGTHDLVVRQRRVPPYVGKAVRW